MHVTRDRSGMIHRATSDVNTTRFVRKPRVKSLKATSYTSVFKSRAQLYTLSRTTARTRGRTIDCGRGGAGVAVGDDEFPPLIYFSLSFTPAAA